MALASTSVFEVRGTGSDANGGCWNTAASGVDYSQQDSAQLALTDVVTNGTATVTSATGGFLSAHIGNGFNIAGAIYQITAVGSSTSVTVDRNATTGSGQTGNVGGALATPGKALGAMVAGSTTWVKDNGTTFAGPITTASISGSLAGASPYNSLLGYGTTRGDSGRPTLKSTTGTVLTLSGSGWYLGNLIIHGNDTAILLSGSGGYSVYYNCLFTHGNRGGGNGLIMGNWDQVRRCEVSFMKAFSATDGCIRFAQHGLITECHFHDCDAISAAVPQANFQDWISNQFVDNVVENFTGACGGVSSLTHVKGNVFYNLPGYAITLAALCLQNATDIRNNLIHTCTTGLYYSSTAFPALEKWNGNTYYNCTTKRSGVGASSGDTLDIVCTADPCVSASTGNFAYNNTSGGGAAARGKGLPLTLPNLPNSANSRDMGTIQHAGTILTLTVNTSGTNPVLTWAADPGVVTGYVVLRGATASALAEITTVGSGTLTYTDTGVSSGTYVYAVVSY